MSLKSMWASMKVEWGNASAFARMGIVSAVLSIVGALLSAGVWGANMVKWRRTATPLPSQLPEYFDPKNFARFESWGISRETALRIAAMLHTENQLDDARELLLDLREKMKTPDAVHFINGLITATWYGQEKHREGLAFLGDISRTLPVNDFRYRFQYHAHLRAVRMREGIDRAQTLIDQMRRKYRRVEYSRVWLGMPLQNMESLHRGTDTAAGGPPIVGEDDAEYLRRLIQDMPRDPFIDHALYVLRDYERVIEEHPKSLLRSTAMQLWIFESVDCELDPGECNVADARTRLARFATDYPEELAATRIHAGTMLARVGRISDAEEIGCAGALDCDRETMLQGAIEGRVATAGSAIAWLAKSEPRLLERKLDSIMIALDQTPEYVKRRDYAGAVTILERCRALLQQSGLTPSEHFMRRLEAFTRLEKAANVHDANGLFELGLAEAGLATAGQTIAFAHLMRSNAADTFQQVQQFAPGTEVAAKASYLRAMALRRVQSYSESLKELNYFLATYPSSPLYDDVLAEKGVHYLEYGGSFEDEEEMGDPQSIFESVATNHPTANAADNALTWIARTHVRACEFADALRVFERVAAEYRTNRLGMRAQEEVIALIPVVRSRSTRPVIEGLLMSQDEPASPGAYVLDVAADTVAERANMEAGDVILAVGNETIANTEAYYTALRNYAPGSLARLTVHGMERTRYITMTVGVADYYPEAPRGTTCWD